MKWNLTHFYNSVSEWEHDYNEIKERINNLANYQGTLSDKDNFKNAHLEINNIMLKLGAVYSYAALGFDLNMKNDENGSRAQQARLLFSLFGQATSWYAPEILSLGKEKVLSFVDSMPELSEFRFGFEKLFRSQEHVLDNQGESILANFSNISHFGELYNALAVGDGVPKAVKLSDREVNVTDGNFRSLIADSKDANDRRLIFEAEYTKYVNNKNTYAGIYNLVLKADWANAKSRNYSSSLESFLFDNNIPTSVFTSLIDVTGKYNEGLKRYYQIRKDYFHLEKHHTYDRFLSMAESNKKYTYEEAKELFFDSIKNMPEEFILKAHDVLKDGFVDVMETEGKQTGAYSSGFFGYHPFILLNFDGTLDSCFTLAHEAGHSIHTEFSNEYQPQSTADYEIFVAEIASTFNEHMLLDYLIQKTTSKNEKIVLLEQAINDICATFYRQALFATYEYQAHKLVEEGKAITANSLSQIMIDLYKQYYDIDITEENGKQYVWAYIPHLTKTPFYVYQYATSYSASLKLYEDIKNNVPGAMDKYLGLLKSGGSDYPVNLVKKAGVDLTTAEPFMAVVRRLDNLLDELEKTLKN